MTEKNGGSAFPWDERNDDGSYFCTHEGMSLRDYFAAKAMSTLIETMANAAMGGATHPGKNAIAKFAYEYADAMLKAREVQS